MSGKNDDLFERVPDTEEVRSRLAENLAEARRLRTLLRVARQVKKPAAKKPKSPKGAKHGV